LSGGIMLFSGSVLENSGDSYTGVGLELHGGKDSGSFRFRSNPSLLEIKANTFFVGSTVTQFISGANSNIEISSSVFHLDPTNNILIMSGTIQASAGNIGNWNIVDGKLSGSNITFDADLSQMYKTDQGPGSDSSAIFDQLRDEYYIDFTPDSGDQESLADAPSKYFMRMGPHFAISSSGEVLAFNVTVEHTITAQAGYLGGFSIGGGAITSVHDTMFISGSPGPTNFTTNE
jgi:hypothetical protein